MKNAGKFLHPKRRTVSRVYKPEEIDVEEVDVEYERPTKRSECPGYRPCPFVSCKYNLFLDITEEGDIRFNFDGVEPWQMRNSCALDVAEKGPLKIVDVSAMVNLTKAETEEVLEQAYATIRSIYDSSGEIRSKVRGEEQ